jgi:transcriptional regulator with XRE-family HTH domain
MAKKAKDNKFSKTISERLQAYRKERNMTLEELAYESEMELTQVHRILSGAHDHRISTLARICEALDVSLSELFEGIK